MGFRPQVCLLTVHTLYISLTLCMFLGRYHGSNLFHVAFANVLYPWPTVMLHASTFLTVLLARHRFNASDKPVEYFIKWKFINPNASALKSLGFKLNNTVANRVK